MGTNCLSRWCKEVWCWAILMALLTMKASSTGQSFRAVPLNVLSLALMNTHNNLRWKALTYLTWKSSQTAVSKVSLIPTPNSQWKKINKSEYILYVKENIISPIRWQWLYEWSLEVYGPVPCHPRRTSVCVCQRSSAWPQWCKAVCRHCKFYWSKSKHIVYVNTCCMFVLCVLMSESNFSCLKDPIKIFHVLNLHVAEWIR